MAATEARSTRVVKDTAVLFGSQLVVGAVGLVSSAWLARTLTATELALWPTCISVASVIYNLGNLGMPDSTVRVVPRLIAEGDRAEAGRVLRTGMAFAVAASAILAILALVFVQQVNQVLTRTAIDADLGRLLMVAVLCTVIGQNLEWGLNAVQEYRVLALCRTLTNVVRPLAMVGLYFVGGVRGTVLGLAIGPALSCLVSTARLLRYFRWGRGFKRPADLFALSLPYYTSGVCAGLIARMDYILVGALGGAQSLATYFVAYKIGEYVKHLNGYAVDTTATKLAETAAGGTTASSLGFTKCSRYIFLGLVPLHMAIAAVGTPIIVTYAGRDYAESGPILSVLCCYLLIEVLYNVHRSHIIVLGGKWHPFVLDVSLAALMVTGTAALAAHYGGLGAALARLIAVGLVMPLAVVLLRQVFRPAYDLPALALGVLGGALMWGLRPLVALISGGRLWPELLIPPGGAMAYLLLLRHRLLPSDANLVFALLPGRLARRPLGRRLQAGISRFLVGEPESAPEALAAHGRGRGPSRVE
jgi:O-antigen/teichoic acid export membrane protein